MVLTPVELSKAGTTAAYCYKKVLMCHSTWGLFVNMVCAISFFTSSALFISILIINY
jgi:hypothetical protein